MKILFFVGELNKNLNASSKIAIDIADYLSKKSVECTVLGINDDEDFTFKENNLKTISFMRKTNPLAYLEVFLKKQNLNRNEGLNKFIIKHPILAFKVFLSYKYPRYRYNLIQKENREIYNRFLNENEFEFIVSFQEPSWTLSMLTDSKNSKAKKIIYQVDPYSFNNLFNDNPQERRKEELMFFKLADRIITTPILEQVYLKDKDFIKYQDKISSLEFPNIKRYDFNNDECVFFDKEYTNIAFCGILDDAYRSPKVFLENFEQILSSRIKIRVYFIGDILSDVAKEFKNKYPNNIFIKDRVDLKTALIIQNEADFLLNIGNTVNNQTPSKIFDYFSFGKPIINIQKIQDCSAKGYIDKYALIFTINEIDYDENTHIKLEEFLKINKNKSIKFDDIKKTYNHCTLEYVAEKFLKYISE